MLVISRRNHQRILIDEDIEIIVVRVHRSSVKLGVNAPKHMTVMRAEIHDEIPRTTPSRWGVEKGYVIAPEAGARIQVSELLDLLQDHGYLHDD